VNAAIFCGIFFGLGVAGLIRGLRSARPLLDASDMNALSLTSGRGKMPARWPNYVGASVAAWAAEVGLMRGRFWDRVTTAMAVVDVSIDELALQTVQAVGTAVLLPVVVWGLLQAGGIDLPIVVPLGVLVLLVPVGACIPFMILYREAAERRRHVRIVVGSFVDLVVLGLAGGVGIEGALQSAAAASSDWASVRIRRALALAQDAGEPSWSALARLGEHLGVPELTELAATIRLAGTEGARVRRSLSARASALRRHEQAEAETEANTVTERLFLPGALLLVGFLLFVGYPAFSRILTGF
jgi:tight adherence protein C